MNSPRPVRLYRGLTSPITAGARHQYILDDRRPRDTGQRAAFNIFFNLMIEHRFGVPLVRRRSLFVTGDIVRAARYASARDERHLAYVEPVGEFRFLFATNVADSASLADELTERYLACFYSWQRDLCRPLLEDPYLTVFALEQFLDAHPEVDRGGFSWSERSLRHRIKAALESCFVSTHEKTFRYSDEDLDVAAESGVEIMIFDCPKGYWLRPVTSGDLQRLDATG